jgi:hypothetical protein
MAFTRQLDDPCELKKRNDERSSIHGYLMDPNKFYHANPSYIEKGIVGGNTVSLFSQNLVDLESDLSGRTRAATKCPSGKFLPGTIVQGSVACKCTPECGLYSSLSGPCGRPGCVQSQLVHLPKSRMINYKPNVNRTGVEDMTYRAPTTTWGRTAKPSSSKWVLKIKIPAWTS